MKPHSSQKTQHDLTPEEIDAAIAAGEAAAAQDLKADVEAVSEQAHQLAAELEQTKEELERAQKAEAEANNAKLRIQADWENYRKRTAAERLEERSRATASFVESILPALDDMERALEHAQTLDDAQVSEFATGVEAVYDKLQAALQKEGVTVIDRAGEAFDPTCEQAVGTVEDTSVPQDSVAAVLRKGYEMGGKVIREAMVTVTCGGPLRSRKDTEDANATQDGAVSANTADESTAGYDASSAHTTN